MGLLSNLRGFSRRYPELLEQLTRIELKVKQLENLQAEMDEFIHRVVRKKYQTDYQNTGTTNVDAPQLPMKTSGLSEVPKAELWNRAKARKLG